MAHENDQPQLVLPEQIVSPTMVSRLIRELEDLSDYLAQAAIRQPGESSKLKLPKTSQLLDDLAEANSLNFLKPEDYKAAQQFLRKISQTAPVIHMSFASDPSAAFVAKILSWLRSNISPQVLLQIGLEPAIAAGCVVRTANKQFDFSLRQHLKAKKPMLLAALSGSEKA